VGSKFRRRRTFLWNAAASNISGLVWLYFSPMELGIWVAKLVARLLATAWQLLHVSGFEFRHLSKLPNGRLKEVSRRENQGLKV
jgi:hypothetical protein